MKKLRGSRWLISVYVCLLLGVFVTLSLLGSAHDSLTNDEVAHIPAGISYVQTRDFRMNPEHPPLIKYLSGLSAQAFTHPTINPGSQTWKIKDEWDFGRQTLYKTAGNNPDRIAFFARLPIVILSALLGLIIYLWGSQLLGRPAGLAAMTLFALDPTMIAYSHLVTFDLPATVFIAAVAYQLWLGFKERKSQWFIMSGISLALALTSKASALAFVAVVLTIFAARIYWPGKSKLPPKRLLGWLAVLSASCWLAVWLIYLLIEGAGAWHHLGLLPHDFIYSLGQGVDRYGSSKAVYIAGKIYADGQFWYLPLSFGLKSPLPLLIFLLIGLVYLFTNAKFRDTALFIGLPLAVLAVVVCASNLNQGIRYLFICYPFIFLLAGLGFQAIYQQRRAVASALAAAASLYYLAALLNFSPNYLSYINEFGGGKSGYKDFADSNVDWGQGLKELRRYTVSHHITGMKTAYAQEALPSYYGFSDVLLNAAVLHDVFDKPTIQQIVKSQHGQLAVSVTVANNIGLRSNNYLLKGQKPYAIVSGSILLYRLP